MRVVFILFFLAPITSLAQFRGSNWAISDSILVHFSDTGNSVSNSVLHCTDFPERYYVEPMATISDDSGKLLFYTNGFTIWNKNNNIMLNGDSLLCDFSTTNGVVIIPFPNHDSLYFVFYLDEFVPNGLSYSIVNMLLDSGLGRVTQKNIQVLGDTLLSKKLSAIKHANGRDWWIVGHNAAGNSFFEFLVTPSGISGPYWENIGLTQDNFTEGEMCASSEGNKLCLINVRAIEIFDFDRCSGELSDNVLLDEVDSNASVLPNYYGCSFSPSGTKLYVSNNATLYQYDLANVNPKSTQTVIFNNPYYGNSNIDSVYWIGQHELALNRKIYITNIYMLWPDSKHYSFQDLNLSIINQPDSLGAACGFKPYSFYLGGHRTTDGLPNMPNYNLGALFGSACDTVYASAITLKAPNNTIKVYPNPTDGIVIIDHPEEDLTITITDLNGKVLISKISSNTTIDELNLAVFSSGTYLCKVNQGTKMLLVKKIVLMR